MRGFSWQGKQISFDNDYAPQVLQMRREYTEIRKVLKDRDIFKTLYPLVWRCSMRMEWRYTTLLRKCRKRSQREDSRCSPSATQTPSWTRIRECLGREVAGARADAIPKREEDQHSSRSCNLSEERTGVCIFIIYVRSRFSSYLNGKVVNTEMRRISAILDWRIRDWQRYLIKKRESMRLIYTYIFIYFIWTT